MNFLNPQLLSVLLPLVAVPLAIHLLNKRFPRQFQFSSIERLRETMARRSQLHRWRHLILLALRTAMVLLLLGAFLKPVMDRFGSSPGAAGRRRVLVLLDHSLSMEYRGATGLVRQRAREEIDKLIDALAAQDLVNVVLMGANPSSCFVEFSRDHNEARRFVRSLGPGLTRADANAALALAGRLIGNQPEPVEIYCVSDFQRRNWAAVDFRPLPEKARVFFVDVASPHPANRAILGAAPVAPALAGDTVALELSVANFAEEPFNGPVRVVVDNRWSLEQAVGIAPWSVAKVTVPVPAGSAGEHRCEVELPADGLMADDRFRLLLPVQEQEEVLIVTDEPAGQPGGARFLEVALNPFDGPRGALRPQRITLSQCDATRLAGVRKVFFTRLGRLSEAQAAVLARQIFQGTGLIYFLDGPDEAQNLALLERALGPNTLPVRLTARRSVSRVGTGGQGIVRGDFKSRHLRLFQGAARQDLGLLEFYDYYQASATGAGQVLLTFADESPAFAAASHGLGTILLLNFSAGELSGNLPRQRLFPAWMQELVKSVATIDAAPTAHSVGAPLTAEVWRNQLTGAELRAPDGRPASFSREPNGERFVMTFTPEQAGFYQLAGGANPQSFAVNVGDGESDLRPVDRGWLPEQLGTRQPAEFVAGATDYEEVSRGRPVWPWFVLAALLLLAAENVFQLRVRRPAAAAP